ncbi:MAG: 2-amino-4-oxopentanoate thiolase subunit OrtA, partial [Spirochaetota bacterium]|nr:2-amino-4-oxopentanoate thiolase subunit OrtA [Spirochaetota bacterium]
DREEQRRIKLEGGIMTAKKGDWVRIHSVLMEAGGRAPGIPDDTANVPYELWDKGFLVTNEAEIGEEVEIETITGRKITGNLIETNPSYGHDFGEFIPEILVIDKQLRLVGSKLPARLCNLRKYWEDYPNEK